MPPGAPSDTCYFSSFIHSFISFIYSFTRRGKHTYIYRYLTQLAETCVVGFCLGFGALVFYIFAGLMDGWMDGMGEVFGSFGAEGV